MDAEHSLGPFHTQKPAKIGPVNGTAWHFGPEDLVKTRFLIYVYKRAWTGIFKSFGKFEIAPLEAQLQLHKL
jgi:hypothetical protein